MYSYAGIGSRQTPSDVLLLMEKIGVKLALMGFMLRSGGADGADSAFERGCDRAGGEKQIFLPWPGFNGRNSPYSWPKDGAFRYAEWYHPAWDRLSNPAKKLMARNAHQVMGPELDDWVKFVVCWTPDGQASGGTGQALRMCEGDPSPFVFNLKNEGSTRALANHLREIFGLDPKEYRLPC